MSELRMNTFFRVNMEAYRQKGNIPATKWQVTRDESHLGRRVYSNLKVYIHCSSCCKLQRSKEVLWISQDVQCNRREKGSTMFVGCGILRLGIETLFLRRTAAWSAGTNCRAKCLILNITESS
jgi:hypothetical protein